MDPTVPFLADIIHVQAIGSVVLLVGFLVATTVFQRRAIDRASEVLKTLPEPVRSTTLYAAAHRYIDRRKLADNIFTDSTYVIPVWFLIIVVAFCSIVSYFGAEYFAASKVPSYVLGGAYAATGAMTPELASYQSGTVFIGSMAFLGAYVWTIARLITRINTDDMSPISFYFLSCRILTACLVAGIARHAVVAIPVLGQYFDRGAVPVGLAALGFAIGWNPTLWVDELWLVITDWLHRKVPRQRWPAAESMPNNLTLRMLQGMVDNETERLNEIGLDNSQRLANANPLIVWLKTSCTLQQIGDWIAQSQLAVRFEDDKVAILRSVGIRDVFAYLVAAEDEGARAKIADQLKIPAEIVASQVRSIRSDPAFWQVSELREALRAEAYAPQKPPQLKEAA